MRGGRGALAIILASQSLLTAAAGAMGLIETAIILRLSLFLAALQAWDAKVKGISALCSGMISISAGTLLL